MAGTLFLILCYASAISTRDFNVLLIYLAFVSILSIFNLIYHSLYSSHLLLLSRLSYAHLSEEFNATHTQCIYFTDIWDLLICLLDLAYPLLLSTHFIRALSHLVEPGSQLNLYSLDISLFYSVITASLISIRGLFCTFLSFASIYLLLTFETLYRLYKFVQLWPFFATYSLVPSRYFKPY